MRAPPPVPNTPNEGRRDPQSNLVPSWKREVQKHRSVSVVIAAGAAGMIAAALSKVFS